MKRVRARGLLDYTTEQLSTGLPCNVRLLLDDGADVTISRHVAVVSRIFWELVRAYPDTKLTQDMIFRLDASGEHKRISNAVVSGVLAAYPTLMRDWDAKAAFSDKIYRVIMDDVFNFVGTKSAYVMGVDAEDIAEIVMDPEVCKIRGMLLEDGSNVPAVNSAIVSSIKGSAALTNNNIAHMLRAGTVNQLQIAQMFGAIGVVAETSGALFAKPILNNFALGNRLLSEMVMCSRMAADAYNAANESLGITQWTSKLIAQLNAALDHVYMEDCGSDAYLEMPCIMPEVVEDGVVKIPSDLVNYLGVYYLDDSTGQLKTVTLNDKHLIGRPLRIRSVLAGCKHPDPVGCCTVCLGKLTENLNEHGSHGVSLHAMLSAVFAQLTLSRKHYIASATSEKIQVHPSAAGILVPSEDGQSYLLSKDIKNEITHIEISNTHLVGEAHLGGDPNKYVRPDLLGTIPEITVVFTNGKRVKINTTSRGMSVLMSSWLIQYMRSQRLVVSSRGSYIVNMDKWHIRKPLFTIPLRVYDLSMFAKTFNGMLERGTPSEIAPGDFAGDLMQLLAFAKQKIPDVSVTILMSMMYTTTARDPERSDYRLMKYGDAGTARRVNMDTMVTNRSAANGFAYDSQAKKCLAPLPMNKHPISPYPLDVYVLPNVAIRAQRKRKALYGR